ncbi:uracil-DNA glycosylase [Enterococcus massiliensis]|uniref:uracil-DNA glycosylase n=1 Tax=Enterococcus massiliensis TaxID=1640685 RepID=UPI00065E84FA|nr:uracil-DNA glycosylase [Enterococcus massiliensis]
MNYPDSLVADVFQRSVGFKLEGFVPGQGPLQPKLMIVGEAPGRKEITNFIPFSGQAGVELMKCFDSVGLTREEVYITSAVRSRPFSVKERKNKRTGEEEIVTPNRTPNKKEVLAHAPILDYEIKKVAPRLIATVGNIGLQRLLGPKYVITSAHGKIVQHPILQLDAGQEKYSWTKNSYTIVPLFHPAAVFYNRKLQPLIEEDWRVIGTLLQ